MKKDNKGFSLVELIIVIAIMAILVVVVAPQYLKYVEKSRISVDQDNAGEIGRAMQIYAADQGNPSAAATVTVTDDGITNDTATATDWATEALKNAGLKKGDAAIKSKNAKWATESGGPKYTVTMGTDGALTFTPAEIVDSDYTPTGG